jgi:hypothetical protein
MGVDELDGQYSFTEGGGAALRRAGTGVIGREHAGNVGLEQVLRVRGCTADDEAVVIAATV